MNMKDADHFSALIHVRLAEIDQEDALGTDGQSVVTLDQQSVGRLSRMDALQNQAMAKAQQTRRAVERGRLHAALARIASGDFGLCDDCGEPIARRRLELNPTVTICISCAAG
jgi:DnaK suppressor protein